MDSIGKMEEGEYNDGAIDDAMGKRRHRFGAWLALAAIAAMFTVSACGNDALQFSIGRWAVSSTQSCEEHIDQSKNLHTEKSIFEGVAAPTPEKYIFFSILFAVVLMIKRVSLPERFDRFTRIAFIYHQRKRWVWARGLPFSSECFFPHLSAQRDF